jgi:hypothetical protein
MVDRDFTEVDLRAMLSDAMNLRPDIEPGRWIVDTSHQRIPWQVIVEPDTALQLLVIVTA